MKRIREFRLFWLRHSDPSTNPDGWCETGENIAIEFSSWHRLWNHVKSLLRDSPDRQILIVDPQTEDAIAVFSPWNLQMIQEDAADDQEDTSDSAEPRWDSHRFRMNIDTPFYENRNHSGFHWQLLDGAELEVPLRLSYLERKAERNPDGWFAYCLALVGQWRDMFARRSAQL